VSDLRVRRSVERRLDGLAGAPLDHAQLRTTDALGNELVRTGGLSDGSYGIQVNSAEHSDWSILRATSCADHGRC
jgi:hypothetical protein